MSITDIIGYFRQRRQAEKLMISAACGCNTGKRRQNNEDNLYFNGHYLESENTGTPETLIKSRKDLKKVMDDGGFFAVFDGMGGADYGEAASFTAAEEARLFFEVNEMVDFHDVSLSLQNFCIQANESVIRAAHRLGTENMGTTVAGLYFFDNSVWVCNIGDSKCFLYRSGEIWQISKDHTDELEMLSVGIKGRKPYLTQYLGIASEEMQLSPYIKKYSLQADDIFLICSDGLTDMVDLEEITSILRLHTEPEDAVNKLIQAALDAGGKDNITAIICRC